MPAFYVAGYGCSTTVGSCWLAPEELLGYNNHKPCRVVEYVPEWKRREDEKKTGADKTPPPPQPEPPMRGNPQLRKPSTLRKS